MALSRALAISLTGLAGQLVEIECDISTGLPGMTFTGLADRSVVDSKDRLRAAVVNSGATWPNRKITVALLPADVRKTGSRFDLAISLAVLAADGQVPVSSVADAVWIAELGLTGALRPVRGVLPSVLAARTNGATRVVVARANESEAALVDGVDVRVADDLGEILRWLTGFGPAPHPASARARPDPVECSGPDLLDVAGQCAAKRALEVAAAGGHHLYLVGSPGAGKTMLAERLPGLLPPLLEHEALDVTAVHSIAGLLSERARLIDMPPIQAPHHTASMVALVGGGSPVARPGAISLAHHGVLFLDEAPEFAPRALDALRQPLETGQVILHRSGGAVRYPARFQLVMAANPCGCASTTAECTCSSLARRRHQQRLSGPLMDRIDLRVQVEPVSRGDLFQSSNDRESSADVAARVADARGRAAARWADMPWSVNADVPGAVLRCPDWLPPRAAIKRAEQFLERGSLTARGFDRVLRTAWTLADLRQRPAPTHIDVHEALFFRTGQSDTWAA